MKNNDQIFNKIARALLVDYSGVYYVNAVTGGYQLYSADPEYHKLRIAHEGDDFFASMKTDAEKVVYEKDKHIFTQDLTKDKMISEIKRGCMQNVTYRLMIDKKPVYHMMRVIRGMTEGEDYFILGVINIDKEMRMKEESERLMSERDIYNQIALCLSETFDTLYYIDSETGSYFEFSSNDRYKGFQVPMRGKDFFAETRENVRRFVHPDDKDYAIKFYYKKNMKAALAEKQTFSYKYRLVFAGKIVNYRFTVIGVKDKRHFIVCVKDINEEIETEKEIKDTKRKSVTYGQIAESLALHYDIIYYVDSSTGSYTEFTSNPIYGNLEIQEKGTDFYSDLIRNSAQLVSQEDRERVINKLDKDNIITSLDDKKQFSVDYKLVVDGEPKYTRLTVMWSSDRVHFIIGVENIDNEVKKEKESLRLLNMANELARRDELTGIKNKTAYTELETSVQYNIENGMDYLTFALVVCDINGLKQINDSLGHKAGDNYICACSALICSIFSHSPVFRIGGDEFVIFIRGDDFTKRERLLKKLKARVRENIGKEGAPVIAAGMSAYRPGKDLRVSEIFERADNLMYEDKRELKEQRE